MLFAGYLIHQKKKASTVRSYISAIKTVLKEDGKEVQEDRYLLSSLIKACKYHNNDIVTLRLPIQKPMLNRILDQVNKVYLEGEQPQPYLCALYRAAFVAASYGLLRIGDIAEGEHPILAKDTFVGVNKDKVLFLLRTSKTHWLDSPPQSVKINSTDVRNANSDRFDQRYNPYAILRTYFSCRPDYKLDSEPFFVYRDRQPVKPQMLNKVLKQMIDNCGIDSVNYSFNSMRAGRSLDLFNLGVSVETIKKIRRWKSNAVFKYLKH